MTWLKLLLRKIRKMIDKMKISTRLKGLSFQEGLVCDFLINEGKSEDEIVSIIKSTRGAIKIEALKQLLKDAGFSEGEIKDFLSKNINTLFSKETVENIFKKITSTNTP